MAANPTDSAENYAPFTKINNPFTAGDDHAD